MKLRLGSPRQGLSQKTVLCSRREILVSFFNSFKKETIFWLPWAKTVF
ncbi:MAG: hypothetical protein KBG02_08735 [Haliscomenobacter sp.]|nr:hypothetical protein [Haliscomenobacter sp.]MBK8654233.1 hypothetical protein [Haliscomenobacter sp.]MBP9076932.1 hypothetical protein [Haliscomenobacter sp.]